MAWVGQVHHEAMQDLLAHWPDLGPADGRTKRVCAAAAALTLKYVPKVEEQIGVTWTSAERQAKVNEVFNSLGPCKNVATMSVFGSGMFVFTSSFNGTSFDDPPGTEAVVAPINAMVDAVKYSDGTYATVTSITSASIASNWSLGTVDLQILAAVANFVDSSASEWNNYSAGGGYGADSLWYGDWDWSQNGGLGGPCDLEHACDPPMSIFSTVSWWRKAAFVLGSDVIGCATGAVATWYTGAAGAGASCVIWGLGTSAVSALGVALL
jgi:hypothetical protein